MKTFLFLLILAGASFCLYQAGLFYYRLQVGKEIARNAIPFNSKIENPSFRILLLGDSTAVGTGAEDPSLSIAGRVAEEYPEALIENRGGNGAKVGDLLSEMRDLKKDEYDVIMLHVGGNDILRFTDLEQLKRDINALLRRAVQKAEVVTLTTSGNIGTAYFLPFGTRALFEKRTLEAREIFMHAAKEHGAAYVDLFVHRLDDPFWVEPETYYASDYLHPSGAGYGIWYEKISPVLQSALQEAGLI